MKWMWKSFVKGEAKMAGRRDKIVIGETLEEDRFFI